MHNYQQASPPDYYAMMRELHKIGNNLNQIAIKAHTLNVIDVKRYDEALRQYERTIKEITEAVVLPEKRDSEKRMVLLPIMDTSPLLRGNVLRRWLMKLE